MHFFSKKFQIKLKPPHQLKISIFLKIFTPFRNETIAIRGNPTFMTFSGDELLLNNGNSMEYIWGVQTLI